MTLTSYAQNFEDVILWHALKHVERGFYIDVGAQDPTIDSVSLAFYEHGWRGVHVEPSADYAAKLRAARPDEEVIQAAIGREAGEVVFYDIPDTGLSTGDEEIAKKHEAEGKAVTHLTMPCLRLASILDARKDRPIHWLKIDVEGMEGAVIDGWEPSEVRPWVVIVESTVPNSPQQNHMSWEPKLLSFGYDFVYFDGLNRFYVSAEHPELKPSFGPGPNFFDGFALSGTASSPFCYSLNLELADLRAKVQEAEAIRASLDSQLAEARNAHDEPVRQLDEVRRAKAVLENSIAAAVKEALAAQAAEAADSRARLDAALREERAAHAEAAAALETSRRELRELHQSNHYHWQLAEARAAEVAALRDSVSWRIGGPLRVLSRGIRWSLKALQWFARGVWAWMTLKPGSRPRRVARAVLQGLARFILARPALAYGARRLFHRLPSETRERLRTGALRPTTSNVASFAAGAVSGESAEQPILSSRGREIHVLLQGALEPREKEST